MDGKEFLRERGGGEGGGYVIAIPSVPKKKKKIEAGHKAPTIVLRYIFLLFLDNPA